MFETEIKYAVVTHKQGMGNYERTEPHITNTKAKDSRIPLEKDLSLEV